MPRKKILQIIPQNNSLRRPHFSKAPKAQTSKKESPKKQRLQTQLQKNQKAKLHKTPKIQKSPKMERLQTQFSACFFCLSSCSSKRFSTLCSSCRAAWHSSPQLPSQDSCGPRCEDPSCGEPLPEKLQEANESSPKIRFSPTSACQNKKKTKTQSENTRINWLQTHTDSKLQTQEETIQFFQFPGC